MKSLKRTGIITLLFSAFMLNSCLYIFDRSVAGNGNVISEYREVGSFEGIHASSGLNVHVVFGETDGEIEVVADENLHEIIITEVHGDELKISTSENIRSARSKDIYIAVESLDFIEVSAAADLNTENVLITDHLDIEVSSAGDLELEVDVQSIEADISSGGEAFLKGTARELTADVSSAGDLHARELLTENCRIDVSSAGDASVYASKELIADASSAGHISYYGNPQSKRLDSSSAGSINPR